MESKVLATAVAALLLTAVLLPISLMMEKGMAHSDQTAEALVKPILDIQNRIESEHSQEGVPVGGLIELEDAWAIEDTREESWDPLVLQMENGGAPLGFDKADNTFYCTLGLETGDAWPEIELVVKNAPENLSVRIVDDYTYDWCSDAVREGYRYELIAYTDTQYSYFGVVFTGLPIVTLTVAGEMSDEYTPGRAAVSAAGYETVDSVAKVHLRGGGFTKAIDKKSFRVEFHTINEKGRDKKKEIGLLGMEPDTDWLLIGNPSDETCMRNHLCWDLWRMWNPDGDVPGYLHSEMVEVFLNDEYLGLYQLMQRYDIEEELERMGGNLNTDYVYRVIREMNVDAARPAVNYQDRALQHIELRHKPESASVEQAFEIIDDYVCMNHTTTPIDDAEFIRLVEGYVEIEPLISYYLFHQAAELSDDNVFNNLYIWMRRGEDGRYTFCLSPWDMDYGFTVRTWEEGKPDELCLVMPMPRRILDLDLMGSREILWRIWNEKRTTILTDDAIYQWIMNAEDMVNRSGAYLRDSLKWYGEAKTLDLSQLASNEIAHMATIDRFLDEIWPLENEMQ